MKYKNIEERFKAKLGPQDPVTGCIEWMGTRHEFGHGTIWGNGKAIQTHRLAWEMKNGPIPEGMCVCHRCDNPPCCNEEHLFLGTHQDNMDDRNSKGRQSTARGEDNGQAKLSADDVKSIRSRIEGGEAQRSVARDFGIHQTLVSLIKTRKAWAHVS